MPEQETTEIAVVDAVAFDMAQTNPKANFEHAQQIVEFMAAKCTGPQYIANIQGRNFPRVEWWVTVGNGLNLFPREVSCERFELEGGGYGYETVVEVWNTLTDRMVTRASAICTTAEKAWGKRDEYAVRSMSITRATGKAYRIGLSALAVMAGLEPTPADEIPPQGFDNSRQSSEWGVCAEHDVPYFKTEKMRSPAHRTDSGGWCNKPQADAQPQQERTAYQEAQDVLAQLLPDDATVRADYIKAVLKREINHPREITDDEWRQVHEAALEELVAMEAGGE